MTKIKIKNLETIRKEYLEQNPYICGITGLGEGSSERSKKFKFWVVDKNMKLIHYIQNVYKKGQYSESVNNKLKKYNLDGNTTRTDSSLLEFEINFFVTMDLKYISQTFHPITHNRLKPDEYESDPESEWFIDYSKQIDLINHLIELNNKEWSRKYNSYEDYLNRFADRNSDIKEYQEFLEWQASGYKDNKLFFLDLYLSDNMVM